MDLTNPDPHSHPRAVCTYPAGCDGCSIDTAEDAVLELSILAGWSTPGDGADPFVIDCAYLAAMAEARERDGVELGAYDPDRLEALRLLAGGYVEAPTGEDLDRWVASRDAGRAARAAL